jgi:cysteine desulfurase
MRLIPLVDGGGQEGGIRSGTSNVPGIVGLGAACELAIREMPAESARLARLRDRLEAGIMAGLDSVSINGDPEHRLPHLTNLSFPRVDTESLLMALDDIAVSAGSACTSLSQDPSFVLRALGTGADAAIRFSLGRRNADADVDYAVQRVIDEVRRLRAINPLGASVVL